MYKFSRQIRLFLQFFVLRFIMGRVRINTVGWKFETSIIKLVSSNVYKSGMIP